MASASTELPNKVVRSKKKREKKRQFLGHLTYLGLELNMLPRYPMV
jgi:hypothetical protein